MAVLFYVIAAVSVGVALPLLVYIMVTSRLSNFHAVWDIAVAGNKLARLYVGIVALAFLTAVVGWLIAFSEHRAEKRVAVHWPNFALQPTAYGGG